MRSTVREWMNDLVVFVDPETLVIDALALMRRRYINSLIVNKTGASPQYGIITSTDVTDKIVAQEQDPALIKVRDIMSSGLIMVHQDTSMQECAVLMHKNHIHHLPVADDAGNIIGMISATDFLVVAEKSGRSGERSLS